MDKISTLGILIPVAAREKMEIKLLDGKSALLYENWKEEIFIFLLSAIVNKILEEVLDQKIY